jgi:zinc protease
MKLKYKLYITILSSFIVQCFLFLIISLLSALANGQNQPETIDSLKMKYELYELKNGLQVLLSSDSSVEDISVEFWLKAGSKDEEANKYGLAHFFEHVTPYGFRGKDKESKLFTSYRTGSNAQVRKDFTRYYLKVKPEGLDLALQYSAERIGAKSSDITEEKVERERIRVLNEINRNSENPFWSANGGMVFQSALFGQTHPYGHSGYGIIENNEKFKLEDLQEWFDQYAHPENTILFVVGNFDKKKAKNHIKKHFGKIPKNLKVQKKSVIPEPNQNSSKFEVQTNSEDHYFVLGWAIPEWGSPEDATFRILANILDERLNTTAKQNKRIIKTNSTNLLDYYQHAGQFGVYASFLKLQDQTEIETLLDNEIKNLIESGITDSELENAKQKEIQTIKKMQKNLGFQYSRTELFGEGLLFKNDPNFYFKRLKKQTKLKKEEVNKTAQKWFSQKPSKVLFKSKNTQS